MNLRERFLDCVENGCMYAKPLDNLRAPNENALLLAGILSEHMLLVNGLQTNYKSFCNSPTYRPKSMWISELDH